MRHYYFPQTIINRQRLEDCSSTIYSYSACFLGVHLWRSVRYETMMKSTEWVCKPKGLYIGEYQRLAKYIISCCNAHSHAKELDPPRICEIVLHTRANEHKTFPRPIYRQKFEFRYVKLGFLLLTLPTRWDYADVKLIKTCWIAYVNIVIPSFDIYNVFALVSLQFYFRCIR